MDPPLDKEPDGQGLRPGEAPGGREGDCVMITGRYRMMAGICQWLNSRRPSWALGLEDG